MYKTLLPFIAIVTMSLVPVREPTNLLHLNSEQVQVYLSEISRNKELTAIDLADQAFDLKAFRALVKAIEKHRNIKLLFCTKQLLSEKQIQDLQSLATTKKGLVVKDSEGQKIGPAYMDWSAYYFDKTTEYASGQQTMYPTTQLAMEIFETENQRVPSSIIDFGCGNGQDTIPLLKMGCPDILAIDADVAALRELCERLSPQYLPHVKCVNAPFMETEVAEGAELFIAAYTLPYRKPRDYADCWEKCVSLIKQDGYFAGEFFGPISNKPRDPNMTYHTEEEVRNLLAADFEILSFEVVPEGSFSSVYGGTDPAWGNLYHVVARKITP